MRANRCYINQALADVKGTWLVLLLGRGVKALGGPEAGNGRPASAAPKREGAIPDIGDRKPGAGADSGRKDTDGAGSGNRGAIDVGHGGGSFVLRNAVPAIAQGFYPDSISSDLHAGSMNGAMMDMPTTMSKFLVMGMPLKDVILRSTWIPAQMIQRPQLGHLSPGSVADVAVWKLMTGEFSYADAAGGRIDGKERLLCELTLKDGRICWNWNALGTVDWRTLPPDYGIRKGIDQIVRP